MLAKHSDIKNLTQVSTGLIKTTDHSLFSNSYLPLLRKLMEIKSYVTIK